MITLKVYHQMKVFFLTLAAILLTTSNVEAEMTFQEVMALPTTVNGWDFESPGYGVEEAAQEGTVHW